LDYPDNEEYKGSDEVSKYIILRIYFLIIFQAIDSLNPIRQIYPLEAIKEENPQQDSKARADHLRYRKLVKLIDEQHFPPY
jgi:hypothetical protein